jgi:hypothetical protein
MVRILCESGVRIKFLNPESFTFCIFDEFFYGSGPEDPDLGSRHTQQL